jgi:hypothetical protein
MKSETADGRETAGTGALNQTECAAGSREVFWETCAIARIHSTRADQVLDNAFDKTYGDPNHTKDRNLSEYRTQLSRHAPYSVCLLPDLKSDAA